MFYVPAITPWWFDEVVEPLIRCLSAVAEIHVLAPTTWRNTGLGEREIERCADLPQLLWSIVQGPGHESLRTCPEDPQAVIDFVTAWAPDYVFCRSADWRTAAGFPGKVRFLMEAGAAPFKLPPHWIVIQDHLFDHGLLPPVAPDDCEVLDHALDDEWVQHQRAIGALAGHRQRLFKNLGIDPSKPVLLLPLEYEHEENFFLMHRQGPGTNEELVAEMAARVAGRATLAVTNHPLNRLHVDSDGVARRVAALGEHVVFVDAEDEKGSGTAALAPHSAAMLLGDSKCFSLAAFLHLPIVRRSQFRSGDWLNTYPDVDAFLTALPQGNTAAPDPHMARRWFGLHVANDVFDPQDPALTPDELIGRTVRRVDSGRWDSGLARFRAAQPEHS